jgi:hypothetical protein
MHTRSLLAASFVSTALLLGGLIVTAPAAVASTVQGKVSFVSPTQDTFRIGKKTYRVSDTAKVLISGKPNKFDNVRNGMKCSAKIAHAVEAQMLVCTKPNASDTAVDDNTMGD